MACAAQRLRGTAWAFHFRDDPNFLAARYAWLQPQVCVPRSAAQIQLRALVMAGFQLKCKEKLLADNALNGRSVL
jgi:hypothetical protein